MVNKRRLKHNFFNRDVTRFSLTLWTEHGFTFRQHGSLDRIATYRIHGEYCLTWLGLETNNISSPSFENIYNLAR